MMEVEDKLKRAVCQIQLKNTFFAYLCCSLKMKEDNKVETAGVDLKGNMFYNRKFFDRISSGEVEFVLCFPKGTLINGEEMKPIEEIKANDPILNYKGRLEKVKRTFKREIDEEIVKICPTNMLPILATKEHPFYVKKYNLPDTIKRENRSLVNQFKGVKPQWVKAKDIKFGDMVAIPKIKGQKYNPIDLTKYQSKFKLNYSIDKLKINKDVAWLMGLYVADGSTNGSGIDFSLNNYTKEDLFSRVINIMKKDFKKEKYLITKTENSRGKRINFSSVQLGRFFRDVCGKDSHSKKIPNFILYNKDLEIVKAFLEGYFRGDGCIVGKRQQYASVSKVLIQEIQMALTRLDIFPNNYLYKRDGEYHILKGRVLRDLANYQGVYVIGKKGNNNFPQDKNFIWVKVEVEKQHYKGEVYNFETEKTHTYCAENIVSHNCHEILHLAMMNFARGNEKDSYLWNLATDLANNTIIKIDGKNTILDGCLVADRDDKFTFKTEVGEYIIEDVSKKNAETLYDEIVKIQKKYKKDGGKCESKGRGGHFGETLDEHSLAKGKGKNLTQKEIQEAKEYWEGKTSEAISISKMKGDLPMGVAREFDELHKEKIDWKTMLQRIVSSSIITDNNWNKPHKNSYNYGVYMPSSVKESVDLSVVVDLSGSISTKEYTDFLSEIIGIARAYQNRVNFSFISHDVNSYDCGLIRNGNIETLKKIKLIGGGGTSHKEAMEMVRKKKPKLAIFFTDGYSDLNEIDFKKFDYKKIFIIVEGGTDEQLKGKDCVVIKL